MKLANKKLCRNRLLAMLINAIRDDLGMAPCQIFLKLNMNQWEYCNLQSGSNELSLDMIFQISDILFKDNSSLLTLYLRLEKEVVSEGGVIIPYCEDFDYSKVEGYMHIYRMLELCREFLKVSPYYH